MPSVFKTTATWTGFIGAPGYTKFSWIDLATTASYTAATDGTRAFFNGIAALLQTTWTVTVSQVLQEYDAATGLLIGEHSAATIPAPVVGTSPGAPFAGGSGAVITWKCNTIYNGRRVQGRSFLVPLIGTAFENNGTLTAGAITTIQTAGDNMVNIALADLAVWAKVWSHPAPPDKPVQIGGQGFSVQTASVRDQASQLRSRRL